MLLIVLSLLAADSKPALRIEAASDSKPLVLKVDGKVCPVVVTDPLLLQAAQAYLNELKACLQAGDRVTSVELKGEELVLTAARGAKSLGKVACGLRPVEGPLRIRAGACAVSP